MSGIYIASTTFGAGKNLFSFALGHLLQKAGFSIGYMKPLGKSIQIVDGVAGDADALIIQEVLGQSAMPDIVSPVMQEEKLPFFGFGDAAVRADRLEKIESAYSFLSQKKDLMIVSGADCFPSAGRLYGIDGLSLVKQLNLKVVIVSPYARGFCCDSLLFIKDLLGESLLGVFINKVPESDVRDVEGTLLPFLEREGLQVFGVLPKCSALQSLRIADVSFGLAAYVVAGNSAISNTISSFVIGTMQVSNFMSFLKQHSNSAVVLGGDRTDLQLAALLERVPCLILTGNISPSELVRERAEELQIPLLCVKEDTYTVAKKLTHLLKTGRNRDLNQIRVGIDLVQQHICFSSLLKALNLKG